MKKLSLASALMLMFVSFSSSQARAGHTFLPDKQIVCYGAEQYQGLVLGFRTTDPFYTNGTDPVAADWIAPLKTDGKLFHARFGRASYTRVSKNVGDPVRGTYTATFVDLAHGKLLEAFHAGGAHLVWAPKVTIVEEVDRDGNSCFEEGNIEFTVREKFSRNKITIPLACFIELSEIDSDEESSGS